jgi:PhnB protein
MAGGSITPYLLVDDGAAAAAFYKQVLGAQETFVRPTDDGRVAHMTLSLNDGSLMLSDAPEWGHWEDLPRHESNAVGWLAIETDDCDGTYERAIAAGAVADQPPEDMPYGRYARFRDPFGQVWAVTQPLEAS